jgi:SSS family solute:Na+ symporter
MGHLTWLDFVMIAAYALAMLLIGWWSSRRQELTEEYFVASRGIDSIVVGISMIATLLSSISYLSTPGEIINNGPGILWGLAGAPVAFLIVGYLVIPRIMRHKITSGYELLHERFGMKMLVLPSRVKIKITISFCRFVEKRAIPTDYPTNR